MSTAVGFVLGGIASAVVTLGVAEAIGRAGRISRWILYRAARQLPDTIREDQLEEWLANLCDVIDSETKDLPITRVARSFHYSTSAWRYVRKLAHESDHDAPASWHGAFALFFMRAGLGAAAWLKRRGAPNFVAEAAASTIWVSRTFATFLPADIVVSVRTGHASTIEDLGTAIVGCAGVVLLAGITHGISCEVKQRLARSGTEPAVTNAIVNSVDISRGLVLMWPIFLILHTLPRPSLAMVASFVLVINASLHLWLWRARRNPSLKELQPVVPSYVAMAVDAGWLA